MSYKDYFHFYDKKKLASFTKTRRFETKLGEKVQVISNPENLEEELKNSLAKFVVVGIPEDVGVRANHGVGGTNTAWQPFLSAFLNIQSNDFLEGSDIILLGQFDFTEMTELIETNALTYDERIDAYRHAVNTIDEAVEPLIKILTEFNKVPIVIGGGHNNCYPLIRGAARGLYKSGTIPLASINCVNLDAHADFRPMEGRHSGNGFTYADEDGYLQKYCIVGLHENYLTQNIWMDVVNDPFIDFITYEDIFIHEKRSFLEAVAHATSFTDDTHTGIEVDLDCIENTLASAATPSGIAPLHARQYVSFAAKDLQPAYLHITEGAAQLADGRRNETTGKLISYLVSDFIKAMEN